MHDALAHYASPYYDPKKAHEYYERTKKLKGRKTGTTLNDAGKEAKTYVRTQINAKRDQDLKNAETRSAQRTEARKKSAKRETYENIRKNSQELGRQLDSLISLTSKLDGPTLRANKERILKIVNSLASKNKQSRSQLVSLYKTKKSQIGSEESKNLTAEKKKIRTNATNTYNSELQKIQNDSKFQKVKTTKKSTRKSTKKTSSKKTSSKKTSSK